MLLAFYIASADVLATEADPGIPAHNEARLASPLHVSLIVHSLTSD